MPLANFAAELRAAAMAGSGPHLALIPSTWIGTLAADDLLLPINEHIPEAEQRELLPVALSGAPALGRDKIQRLFGLPLAFDTLVLLYNSANLLTPPTDTTALLSSARGLSAPDATPPIWGLALNLSLDTTIGYLYAFGGQIFDQNGMLVIGNAGRAGTERWLAWVHDLSADRRILARPDSSIVVDSELRSGRVLATFDWAHQIAIYRSLWGERIGIAALPHLAETARPPQPYVRSDILTINGRTTGQERTTALAFLQYMITADAQLGLLHADLQPARMVPLADTDPNAAAARIFRAQAQQGLPMPNGPERTAVEQELRFMLQQVLNGFTSPTDAVSDADRRLRSRLGLS
jgi:maltose-binding protein MalE